MPTERFTNNGQSTLGADITNVATNPTVASASTFPTSGNFRIRIDDEIMLVTAVSGTTFTVTRAYEGTTAVAHTSGATVRHVLTAGSLSTALGGWIEVIKAADETVTSSAVLQDDDELFFTATNGVWFEFEGYIEYISPVGGGTPDIKWAMGEDNTATRGVATQTSLGTSDTAAVLTFSTNNTLGGTSGTATTKRLIYFKGYHLGAGGTFKFRWCQNTSGGNGVTVSASSKLRYRVLDAA